MPDICDLSGVTELMEELRRPRRPVRRPYTTWLPAPLYDALQQMLAADERKRRREQRV